MKDLQEERESLFGFTDDDHDAWSKGGGSHKHDASFLERIEDARRRAPLVDDEPEIANDDDSLDKTLPPVPPVSGRDNDEYLASGLTHLSDDGTSVHMVDVGSKQATQRRAVAQSTLLFPPGVTQAFSNKKTGGSSGTADLVGPKGPIFATAKIAGIMAAKRTSELIPLCHPLPLDQVNVDIRLVDEQTVVVECECRVTHKTGVEMEALTGASVAALCIYDMMKALTHKIRIQETRLVHKSGGKRLVDEEEKE